MNKIGEIFFIITMIIQSNQYVISESQTVFKGLFLCLSSDACLRY